MKGTTQRQREVLHWIALGKSNSEIGSILGVSPHTVRNTVVQIARLYGVSGTHVRVVLVVHAILHGDIDIKALPMRKQKGSNRSLLLA